jgi:hypothetical protein
MFAVAGTSLGCHADYCQEPEDCEGVVEYDDTNCEVLTCENNKCGKDRAAPGTECDDQDLCTTGDGE